MKNYTVALRMVRTDEAKKLRKSYECHEVHHGFNEHRVAEPRTDGLVNTLSTVQKDNLLLDVQDSSNSMKGSKPMEGTVEKDGKVYAIRKLTPLECWRLMGFSDEDFHKAEAVNSNTQLYKQAGNSIVKDVLMAIFSQMIEQPKGR